MLSLSGEIPERSSLPMGSRLPLPANPQFYGRDTDLRELAQRLLQHGSKEDETGSVVISGVEGVGKTQLALEFCYRYGSYFAAVHWVRGEQNLMAEMAACAQAYTPTARSENYTERVQHMMEKWLDGSMRLVVIDSAPTDGSLQDWISKLPYVRFLLTTPENQLHKSLGFKQHALYVLSPAESRFFFREQVPRLKPLPDQDVDILTERLWRMPYSMHLAVCCLANCERLELDGYLSRLEDALASPRTSAQREWIRSQVNVKAASLVAAYDLNWQLLQAGNIDRLAKQIFRVCGNLAPDVPIPLLLLEESLALKGESGRQALDKALERLYSLGLLQKTTAGPAVHSLMAYFARIEDQQAEVNLLPSLADALTFILHEAPGEKSLTQHLENYREHLAAVARAAEVSQLEQAGELLDKQGNFLESLTDYQGAQNYYERALSIDEKLRGETHALVALRLNNLAGVLRVHGNLPAAQSCYERALGINEKAYGKQHLTIAEGMSNLGSVLRMQGDLAGAENCYRQALSILEESLGLKHKAVALAANNLGSVLRSQGNLAGAQACYEKVLQIDEVIYPPEHPEIARDVNNLGSVLRSRGDLYGAKACYELSLRIWEKALNPQHPVVALAESNLGSVLEELGELTGARLCFEQALAIDEAAYGVDHPNVAVRANNLGRVLHLQSDLDGAKTAFMRALRIDEASFDEEHPNIARDLNNLGMILKDLGDLAGAEAYYERALAILKNTLGANHVNVAMTVNNLGSVLEDVGDKAGAKACYEQALAILEKAHGTNHPTVASVVNNLGSVLEDLGRLDEAKTRYERALKIWEKTLGQEHPDVATAVNNLGSVLRAQGDLAGAKACWERALRIDQAIFGHDHPVVGIRYNNLADILDKEGDTEKARDYYERAATIFAKFFPEGHPNLQVVIRNLESLEERIKKKTNGKS